MKDPLLRAGALLAMVFPIVPIAATTAQTSASILGRLPKDATNVLVVRDPLPYVDAVLASPELRAAAAATADLQDDLFGMDLDPARLAKMLQPFRDFVPTEVVVAAAPATAREVARIAAVALYGGVLTQGGSALSREIKATLTKELTTALQALQPPTVSGWVRFRSERMASRLFDQIGDLLAAAGDGIERTSEGDRMAVAIHPAQMAGGKLAALLRAIAVDPAPLAAMTLQFALEQRGDALLLELGTRGPGALAAAALGPLWRDDAAQLVFFHADCEDAQDDLNAIAALLREIEWPESVSGMVTALCANIENLDNLHPQQSTGVRIEDGVVITTEADLGDATELAVALEAFGLVQPPEQLRRCIDPADGPFALAGVTLDFAMAQIAQEAVNRLERQVHRRDAERTLELVLQHGAELIEFLGDDASAVFQPGVAVVTRAANPPARSGGPAGEAASPAGATGALPFGAIAVVALANNAAAGHAFVERMTELVAGAFGATAKDVLQARDFGLGAPTMVFALPDTGALPEPLRQLAQVQLHWLQRGELMVLSTDPDFTRVLLARIDAERSRGAAAPAPRSIGWKSCRGDHAAAILGGTAAWLDALSPRQQPSAALRAFAALVAQVDTLESHVTVDGSRLRDVTALRLRPRAPK